MAASEGGQGRREEKESGLLSFLASWTGRISVIGGLFTLSAGTEDGGADVGSVCAGFPAVSGKKKTVNTVN